MNCSRIPGKYRLQYDFDDLLLGNAEQHSVPLSMWLRVGHPMLVFPSFGVLAIRLDDRASLSFSEFMLIHVVVIFNIGFVAVQDKPEPILSTFYSDLAFR